MSKLTRNGIAYDLRKAPEDYTIKANYYDYDYDNEVKYVFSSELYKNKFLERCFQNREKINESLTNRFGIRIKNDILADLKLYQSIEKRGFLIFYNGVAVECPENITLDGSNMIVKS